MAIKPIEEIPLSPSDKRRSYREKIREDIRSAISGKIDKFEFDGDYNWKYLAQYAREEADMIWRKTYSDLIRKKKEAAGLNDGHYYVGGLPSFKLKGQYIKISSVKMPDRNHVYCSIDFDAPEKLTDQAIKEMLEDKAEEERKAAETTEKAKNKDLTAKIKDLEFSHRTRTVLLRAGVNIDKKKFARNLNNALAKKDWSQSDLARAIGIDVANVNAYVNAKCFPHVAVLWQMAKAFGMTIEELIDGAIEEE